MTRKLLLTASTAVAMIAGSSAIASEDSASDLTGNSPAITEGGDKNVVGSTTGSYDTNSPRIVNGVAEYDPVQMSVPVPVYNALAEAVGDNFKSTDGTVLGVVTGLDFDAQGNPEIEIDLAPETKIDAETLVITALPESLVMMDGKIYLGSTVDELYLQAQQGSKRDSEDRTTIVIM